MSDPRPDWQSGDGAVALYCGDCLEVLPTLAPGSVQATIADPPFSERTHKAHNSAEKGQAGEGNDGMNRKSLGYSAWSTAEVIAACRVLPTVGWCCVFCDHSLAVTWEQGLRKARRYVFAPVPCVVRGRSVRLSGDGPSSWTDWLIPARTAAEARWGTLPGCYDGSPREIEHKGGKPVGMMCAIVRDYSRQGDTVLDFCMGAATTGIACLRTGRRFIGIERDPETFAIARDRIIRELNAPRLPLPEPPATKAEHPELFP